MPSVSVIIPTHNRAPLLCQAIRSVLDQSFPNYEVIVVDDGSNDDTANVVQNFEDKRVHYLYQTNAGRSAARNRGLALAQGGYIALLDDDDLFLPQKLASQVAFLEDRPHIDLVGSGVRIINERGATIKIWHTWRDQPNLTLLNCLYGCPLPTCAVLFRRSVLDRLGSWFDPELDLAEDTDFFIRMLLAGCRMEWLHEIVSAYRIHRPNSQQDGALYSRSYRMLLDKLFTHPHVPMDVLEHKSELYAHYHLLGACHAYATRQVKAAQTDLMQALSLNPELATGPLPEAVARFSGFANSFRVAEPMEYIEFVFNYLPPELAHLERYRNEARSAVYMQRVFRAKDVDQPMSIRDWFLGMCYSSRWIWNRGVWAILVNDIFRKLLHIQR